MSKPVYRFDFSQHYARRLNSVSRTIIERAFFMGGTHVRYFRATPCPYVFPNGEPCRDAARGTWNPECPVCQGGGALYEPPVDTVAIMVGNQHEMQGDKGGWGYGKTVRMVTPAQVRPTTFKLTPDGRQYRLPDRFEILDQSGQVWYMGYCADDVDEPYFYGPLYNRVSVTLSAPPARPETHDLPRAPVFHTVRDAEQLLGETFLAAQASRELPPTAHVDLYDTEDETPTGVAPPAADPDPWGWK